MKRCNVFALLFMLAITSFAQNKLEYYIATNANLYIPISSDKHIFPVLGYSKKTDPKLLIGGFGVGMHVYKPVPHGYFIKGGLTINRHVYWEEGVEMRDQNNIPIGTFSYSSVDHTLHIMMMGAKQLGGAFRLGVGLGAQVLLFSRSRLPDKMNSSVQDEKGHGINGYYKAILPTLPLELSYHTTRHVYAIRFEQALMNRYNKELSPYRKDIAGILSFEFGWRIFNTRD